MLKVASWNVNSLTVRLDQVLDWLEVTQVDVLLLQETKLENHRFPSAIIEERGYHVAFSGQKSYNGVAIISRYPIEALMEGIPGLDDPQRRVIAATIQGVRMINVYVPNGAAVDADKYQYKLHWLSHVTEYIEQQLKQYPKLLIAGDFNIAPTDNDVHDPVAWEGNVLVSPPEREALSRILALGLHDSFRLFSPEEKQFSWWDYRAGGFRRNHGLRIDLILISDALQEFCSDSLIDNEPRRHQRPSDHAPVLVFFVNVH